MLTGPGRERRRPAIDSQARGADCRRRRRRQYWGRLL